MNDAVRAALMAFFSSLLNAVVLLKLVELDGDQLGGLNLLIGNAVLLVALFWKKGQGSGTV